MGIKRLSILGVGLLGGSIGLAVRKLISGCTVVGYGHRPDTLRRAVERGAIHEASATVAGAVRGADLVILATPVGWFQSLLKEMAPALKPGAIVTDVGSTKRSVTAMAETILPAGVHFVGSHPMAGGEKRGVEFATADLFQNAACILTPTARTNPQAAEIVRDFWRTLGMRLIDLSPQDHDAALAQASHLPHAVAAALVLMQHDRSLEVVGKGFLDATRIAGGDGALWRDILLDNADNVQGSIESFITQLRTLSALLKGKEGEKLAQWLNEAAHRRNELPRNKPI